MSAVALSEGQSGLPTNIELTPQIYFQVCFRSCWDFGHMLIGL